MDSRLAPTKIAMAAAVLALCIPAHAADVDVPYVKVPPATLYNWSGLYVGANLGGAFGSETATVPTLGSFSTDPSGVLGGGQMGYNFMFSPHWLLGVEGEVDLTSAKGNVVVPNPIAAATIISNPNWFDSLEGRLGFVQGPWLYYVKGGAAWMAANYRVSATFGGVTSDATVNSYRPGWTIGAGVEYMLSPWWSAKFEYDFLDFGSQNLTIGIPVVGFNTQVHEFKLGVNFHLFP
jgi:opacity protein-like surface antigen